MPHVHGEQVPLRVRLQGPGARNGRILLTDLVHFGHNLQTAVDRVARVLMGDATSIRPGKKPREIQTLCALQVVALESGSFELAVDLARQQAVLEDVDLGIQALEHLVTGIDAVASERAALPPGYDLGVLLSWRDSGRLLDRGIDQIEFQLHTRHVSRTTRYDRRVHARVVERIQEPIKNRRSFEGRLLMADFKETGPRCRLHLATGRAIPCSFDYGKYELVLSGLLRHVRVTGDADINPATGEVSNLNIEDLEVLETDPTAELENVVLAPHDFWKDVDIHTLAEAQQVRPVARLEALVGDFWPPDEEVDEVIRAIHGHRRLDRGRGAP